MRLSFTNKFLDTGDKRDIRVAQGRDPCLGSSDESRQGIDNFGGNMTILRLDEDSTLHTIERRGLRSGRSGRGTRLRITGIGS